MIKVYLDWNIMSSMKRGGFIELKSILDNKEKFLITYSTSHIGDIFASHSDEEKQKKVILEDLNYISSITDNNCFFNDGKNNIQLGFMDPIEMYNDRIDSQDLFKDFSIDNLFSPFDDEDNTLSPLTDLLKNLLKSIPLDNTFKEAFKNPQTADEMGKMFPGLKDDLTFEGWFKYFGNMFNRLNESEDYKELREAVQKIGVNSSHFSQDKDPYDVIGKAYQKIGMNPFNSNDYFDNSKNAPIWFNELSNEYIMLDMHGYKQDKVKVDIKNKKTFRNTTDDAFHSAFASRCDFYITNDKKNIDKTKTVYSKFEVETCVFTPEEFTKYYHEYLDVHGFNEHFSNLIDVLETGKNYYAYGNEVDKNGKPFCFVGFSNHYFFNFFNKVRICKSSSDNSMYYLISRNYSSKIYYFKLKEIENVITMLIENLGMDDEEKGLYITGEIDNEEWGGRKWALERMQISFKRINGWFQLYFYPISEEKTTTTKIKEYFKRIFKK